MPKLLTLDKEDNIMILEAIWGLRVLDAQVVSLLSAEFLASKDRGKHHMLKDL